MLVNFPKIIRCSLNFILTLANVKSPADSRVLLEGTVGSESLYVFHKFSVAASPTSAGQANVTRSPHCLRVSCKSTCNKSVPCSSVSNVNSSSVHPVSHCTTSITSCNNNTKVQQPYYVWHCRLGHVHDSVVKTILHKCNISNFNENELDFCLACCFGKSSRAV